MLFIVQPVRTVRTPTGEVLEHLPSFFVEAFKAREARLKAERLLAVHLRGVENVAAHIEPVLPETLRRMEQENAGVFS